MIDNHIPVQFSDKRRRFIDRLTRRVVTACGIGILLVMMLLFFWLIWVVTPLFSSPSLQSVSTFSLWQPQPAVALGLNGNWGWRIDQQGMARFIPLSGEPAEPALQLANGPVQAALTADKSAVLLLQSDDSVKLVSADFTARDGEPRWKFPLGDIAQKIASQRLQHPAVARSGDDQWLAAASTGDAIVLAQLRASQPPVIRTINAASSDQLLLTPDGKLLFALAGNLLRVWRITDDQINLRDIITLQEKPQQMQLLSGGNSLLIAGPSGVAQWFDIASATGPHLNFIRYFNGASTPSLLITEAQRRVFATLNPRGELQLFASKQDGAIFAQKLVAGIRHAEFAPQGDGLLVERSGQWQYYRLHNPWPDFSWRSLWQKVWYENYPEPAWVWQSTAADDHYQAKFSLMPMVSGTLKASALALLFATPLALAAAIYSAWFMSPALRRWVKPGIEMMGALPSVVVGLIAGLWLAPRIADHLLGVLLLPFMLALALLLCAWGSRRLPARWQRLCADGREVWLLLPLLLLVSILSLWLWPLLDSALFGRGLADRLTHGYEQRNLLVAGVAMGFALVPLIFTLAEDAIFSVPASLGQGSLALGATPWQTLSRVVLPSASAGIFAALMIGFGRAVGETMIVLMATGNTPVTDGGLFDGLRTLSANIAVEMPEAAAGSAHYRILFLSALVLLVFTLVVNTLAELVRQRLRQRFGKHEGQG
ncbi:phosphate transport system permease protein [Erwinia toletana]|uniref:Phosphate transport system permease protein n=1 Tax=Winslowiella toletana TaxID=92490 RepID=A0ABS4P5C8_9GAMM|nr:ABC transporter permease subunit [Winslowiella toletana]MBP2167847.1 phosphate transport system permease protein [Winslowiella toletana]